SPNWIWLSGATEIERSRDALVEVLDVWPAIDLPKPSTCGYGTANRVSRKPLSKCGCTWTSSDASMGIDQRRGYETTPKIHAEIPQLVRNSIHDRR
ncbi:hypothetical protein, partial [Burkholderia cepacia]|uniref:hypothetical protein n=1 Tax=Burkholderia cepacia TaxID=292 RepID=UPI001E4068A8